MTKKIRVALMGLGEVGEIFAEHFLEQIQEGGKPIEIVAVADHNTESPIALGFAQNNVPVLGDGLALADLGDTIDVIFDLTGSISLRQALRLKLLDGNNIHTIVVPEVVARILWCFFDEARPLPEKHAIGY